MSESHASIDENALIENFDYEPNSDDTSFNLPTIETESSVSIFTVTDSGFSSNSSIFTVDTEEEETPLPAIKCWEEVFTLAPEIAREYAEYLEENIIDIPRVFFKLVNDQLDYIRKL
jgi:hypothetical protein